MQNTTVHDPVCHMDIDPATAAKFLNDNPRRLYGL